MYFIGIDNGGTNTKVALHNDLGECICMSSVAAISVSQSEGFAERNMNELWENICILIRDVMSKSSVRASQVAGVCCTGHGKGVYLVDQIGNPVRPAILSTDLRATQIVEKWENCGLVDVVKSVTHHPILPSQPIALIAYLKEHEKQCLEETAYIFSGKDYLRYKLTDIAHYELTDASSSNLVDITSGEYAKELFNILGIRFIIDLLPPLVKSFEIVGGISENASKETGLLSGTPVVAGAFDINTCALAAGVFQEDKTCIVTGTWSINERLSNSLKGGSSTTNKTLFCVEPYYLFEESSSTSAGNLSWFLDGDNFFNGLSYNEANHLVSKRLSKKDSYPLFFPFLTGSNLTKKAKSSIIGLSQHHRMADILLSIYEGVAFSHKTHLERLKTHSDQRSQTLRLTGGVANSDVWLQIFADVLEEPIEVVGESETGSLGCAMMCAVALKRYATIEEAVQAMVNVKKVVQPRQSYIDYYNKRYLSYIKADALLAEVWNQI